MAEGNTPAALITASFKGFPRAPNPEIAEREDTVEPIRFDRNKQAMSETLSRKMEIMMKKKVEKGIERMRARTPDTRKREDYADVIEGPLLVDYVKALQFFKDEMDEEAEEHYHADLKYANELVSPLRWDSNTVVVDVFRVLQDLTPYTYDFLAQGNMTKF